MSLRILMPSEQLPPLRSAASWCWPIGRDVASARRAATDVNADFDLKPCLQDLLAPRLIVAFNNEDSQA